MANTIIINSVVSQGDNVAVAGTVNGASVTTYASRTVLNSLATAVLAQQYLAFLLLHAAPQAAASQLPISVIPGTVNL